MWWGRVCVRPGEGRVHMAVHVCVFTRVVFGWQQELIIAHVGDCRAVLGSKDGSVQVLTEDHTYSNYKVIYVCEDGIARCVWRWCVGARK